MVPAVKITGYLERIQPSGSKRHARFNLCGLWAKFGRGGSNDLVLPLLTISRHHAEFQYRDDHWEMKDVSQHGICINYELVTHRDYVVLENNDIISFIPGGSVDYRFVSGGTLQHDSNPNQGQMLPPWLPPVPGPSRSRATMMSPTNMTGIALKRIKVETAEESSEQLENHCPTVDDGTSSVRSADTESLPGRTGSPSVACLGTPAYCCDPAEQARRQNSTQANQLRHCQQRIENLESELERIRSVSQNSQRDLESARTDTQMRVQGDLIQVLEDDLNCVICSDILIEPTVVECGHVFCSHCITVWIEERRNQSNGQGRPNCPSCRTEINSPRRVRGWDSFFNSVFKLLPTATQENRVEILQQRQDQHEGWEAERVVQRAEQEEARQRRLEEERARAERRARAEARARVNAERASTFLYNRLLQRYMAQESRNTNNGNGRPTPNGSRGPSTTSEVTPSVRQAVVSSIMAQQSAAMAPRPAAPAVSLSASVARTLVRRPLPRPPPPPIIRASATAVRPTVSVAGPAAAIPRSPEINESSTAVRPPASGAARSAPIATASTAESIRQGRVSQPSVAQPSVASRDGNGENNWSRLSIQDALQALDMNDPILQLHRVDASNSNTPASPRVGISQQSAPASGNANNGEARRARAEASDNTSTRRQASTAAGPASLETTPQPLVHSRNGTEPDRSLLLGLNQDSGSVSDSQNRSHEERRAIRIPPLAVHPSRVVRSPAPDHRVPSPAPSLASNGSNLSDPFARAGGIPIIIDHPLLPPVVVPAQVGNSLNDERANQLDMNVGRNGGNQQEQEGTEQQWQGSRNVARRGRPSQAGRPARSVQVHPPPARLAARAGPRIRRQRRNGSSSRSERRSRPGQPEDERQLLNQVMELFRRPPSETGIDSGRRSSRSLNDSSVRNEGHEIINLDSPEPQFNDDDLEILYESSEALA